MPEKAIKTVTVKADVFNIYTGRIYLEKDKKYKVREIEKRAGFYSRGDPGRWIPEEIFGVKLEKIPGSWFIDNFKEFDKDLDKSL
jgi:hypothetical protein